MAGQMNRTKPKQNTLQVYCMISDLCFHVILSIQFLTIQCYLTVLTVFFFLMLLMYMDSTSQKFEPTLTFGQLLTVVHYVMGTYGVNVSDYLCL